MKTKFMRPVIAMLSVVSLACAPQDGGNAAAFDAGNLPEYPLLWSARDPGLEWTVHTMGVIRNEVADDLLDGAADVQAFCPGYERLNDGRRANFWALLVSAIAKYESGFDPTDRYLESSSMGKDPVTGQRVWSEGLLQLSYGDARFPFCEFDWDADRRLRPDDPRKTIFDPDLNLSCGIKILARQIRTKGRISVPVGEGAYWSTLHRRAPEIRSLTRKMPGCQ